MKKLLAGTFLALLFSAVCYAKHSYPITLTVFSESNQTNKNISFSVGSFFHSLSGGLAHGVTTYVLATGTDGNAYQMVPENRKVEVIPGAYPARFDGKEMIILRDKHEVKLKIVDVGPIPKQK